MALIKYLQPARRVWKAALIVVTCKLIIYTTTANTATEAATATRTAAKFAINTPYEHPIDTLHFSSHTPLWGNFAVVAPQKRVLSAAEAVEAAPIASAAPTLRCLHWNMVTLNLI